MNEKLVVGIAGFKGSGKSLASNFFKNKGFVELSFADSMKYFIEDVFPFDSNQLWGPSQMREIESEIVWSEVIDSYYNNKLKLREPFLGALAIGALNVVFKKHRYQSCFYASAREILQTIGEWGRSEINRDLWINTTLNSIYSLPGDKFVISDIRHKNELQRIRTLQDPLIGYTLRVNRKEYWDANPDKDPRVNTDKHPSEQELLTMGDNDFHCVLDMPEGTAKVYEVLNQVYNRITN